MLVWLVVIGCVGLTASLPDFNGCDHAGWSCEGGYEHLIFTCSHDTGWDVDVDLGKENIHGHTLSVTVQNCQHVNLLLSLQHNLIRTITITNITELMLLKATGNASHPARVIFRNIGFIPVIPTRTFNMDSPFASEEIILDNVNVGQIKQLAFNVDASLSILNSNINLVDTKAIEIKNVDNAFVKILNSKFDSVESNGLNIYSPKVTIMKSNFIQGLREQSVVVTTDFFMFYLNRVNKLLTNAFNISALNITFVSNEFGEVQSHAFEEVHPLYNDTDPIFYQFRENIIHWSEPFSLYHNWELYDREIDSENILITDNHFNCTCALLGLREVLSTEETVKTHKFDFYKTLLAEDSNECMNTYCNLPFRYLNLTDEISPSCVSKDAINSLCLLKIADNVRSSSLPTKLSGLLLFMTIIMMITKSIC